MPSHFLCDLPRHICGQYCLTCGQLSFYCFISASFYRNNSGGPQAAGAHMDTAIYICSQRIHSQLRVSGHVWTSIRTRIDGQTIPAWSPGGLYYELLVNKATSGLTHCVTEGDSLFVRSNSMVNLCCGFILIQSRLCSR